MGGRSALHRYGRFTLQIVPTYGDSELSNLSKDRRLKFSEIRGVTRVGSLLEKCEVVKQRAHMRLCVCLGRGGVVSSGQRSCHLNSCKAANWVSLYLHGYRKKKRHRLPVCSCFAMHRLRANVAYGPFHLWIVLEYFPR